MFKVTQVDIDIGKLVHVLITKLHTQTPHGMRKTSSTLGSKDQSYKLNLKIGSQYIPVNKA